MPGLLAGLDALVVAAGLLAALLLVSAVLRPLLVSVLADAPVLGGWLASNVDSGLRRFEAALIKPANAAIGLLASALQWIAYQLGQLSAATVGLAEAQVVALQRLATVTLPHQLGLEAARAEHLAELAKGYALGLVNAAMVETRQLYVASEHYASGLLTEARREAAAALFGAEVQLGREVGAAEVRAAALVKQAELEALREAGRVEAVAFDLTAGARAEAAALVGAVESDLQRLARAQHVLLTDTASALGADIGAAEERAQAAISGVESATAASIEGILNSIPWQALAAAVGASEEMLRAEVRTLVLMGAAEIAKTIGDAQSIRARYTPEIRAALADLERAGILRRGLPGGAGLGATLPKGKA